MAELDGTTAVAEKPGVENEGEGVQGILDSGQDITAGGKTEQTEFDTGPENDGDGEKSVAIDSGDEGVIAGEPGDGGSEDVEFFPELLSAAGMTEQEARDQFGTPDALANAIRMLDTRFVSAGSQQLTTAQQSPADEDIVAAPREVEFKMPEPAEGEEWDENTKRIVQSLTEQYNEALKQRDKDLELQAQATLDMMRQQEAASSNQYVQEFDGFISALGPEWAPLFGEGPGTSLHPNSLHLQNRFALDETAAQLAAGRAAYGQPPLPMDELLARAAMVAFPDYQASAVEHRVNQQVAQRSALKTSRPSQRRAQQLTPTEKAAETAVNWYKKHGMSVNDDDFDQDEI